MKHYTLRAARRPDAEAAVDLSQTRAWYANTIPYGFIGLQALYAQRVEAVGVQVVNNAIAATMAEYNRQLASLTGTLVTRTTNKQFRTRLWSGAGTLQPLDEWGNPLPVKQGESVTWGLPLQRGGTAWGTNRESRALMTVEEAAEQTLYAMYRDIDWMKRHIMASFLDKDSWVYEDEEADLTVLPLANGDTQTYLRRNGANTIDSHYLGQAAEILDASPAFPTIEAALIEHPENSGAIIHYIASDLVDDVQALAAFVPLADPDLRYGADQTILPAAASDNLGYNQRMIGFGDRVLGKYGNGWIVEWGSLPNHYIFSRMANSGPIVAMREQPAAQLQGFFPEFFNEDGNRWVNRFIRIAGFGVINRTGAVVMEIADATYDTPTGYDAPLAV